MGNSSLSDPTSQERLRPVRLRQAMGIYVITDSRLSLGRTNLEVVRQATGAGARLIQLREKELSTRELVAMGEALLEVTRAAGALLLVNDRVDVALAIGADGVHLGQDDLPANLARGILGPGKIIGVSAESPAEARAGEESGADYLGVGPIYATSTKADAGTPHGPALIGRIKAATSLPVVAIGGIKAQNATEVGRAGADGIAVVSAVVARPDIGRAVLELDRAFRGE